MHDLALAKEILEIVESHAKKHGLSKVREIDLELGEMIAHAEDISPDHFREHFSFVAKNSVAADAKVNIKKTVSFKGFKLKDIVGD